MPTFYHEACSSKAKLNLDEELDLLNQSGSNVKCQDKNAEEICKGSSNSSGMYMQ